MLTPATNPLMVGYQELPGEGAGSQGPSWLDEWADRAGAESLTRR